MRFVRRLLNPWVAGIGLVIVIAAVFLIGGFEWNSQTIVIGILVLVLLFVLAGFIALAVLFPHQKRNPVLAQDDVVDVLGARIRYRHTPGNGPTILLVHGNNLAIDDWDSTAALLTGRDLVALDLVGYAGSERPPHLPYDKECQRRYLVAFMDAVGIDRAILVGHSMGGTVVGWTAANSPERVLGSVLIGPPGIPGSLIYAWPKSLITKPGVLNRLAKRVAESGVFRTLFPLALARQGLGVTGSYDDAYLACLDDIGDPMMLIWSSGDHRCPIRFADVYRQRVTDVDVRVLPTEVGHMVPMDEPVETARLVAEFADRIAARGARPESRTDLGSHHPIEE